jgi:hypothetical protein
MWFKFNDFIFAPYGSFHIIDGISFVVEDGDGISVQLPFKN